MTYDQDEIAELKRHAADLTTRPRGRWCYTRVALHPKGVPLATLRWSGQQWAATDFGVEARNGRFRIPVADLWRNENSGGWIHWMSKNRTVNLPDFADALKLARRYAAGPRFRSMPPAAQCDLISNFRV